MDERELDTDEAGGTTSAERLTAGLNEEQQRAVVTVKGPVLILAGPGSGKTRVITHRIAYLIEAEHVAPWNILAVTFTNKAAKEMKERLENLVGTHAKDLHVGTFHSICARVLRTEMETLDFGRTRNFTILDDDEQQAIIRATIKAMDLNEKQYKPSTIQGIISRAKNDLLTPRQFAESASKYIDEIAARVYQRYEDQLRNQNAVDFDDLILLTHQLWRRNPEALVRAQNRYHYIHVDEFQDCNRAQYELVRLLAMGMPASEIDEAILGKRNICVVGDEDQCLIAGTKITLADGSLRNIESIVPGDTVLSAYGHGDFGPALVQDVVKRHQTMGICITTSAGRTLVSTAEHIHFAGFPKVATQATLSDIAHPYDSQPVADSVHVQITLCERHQETTQIHRLVVSGKTSHSHDTVTDSGVIDSFGPIRHDSEKWQVEGAANNVGELLEKVDQLRRVVPITAAFSARFGRPVDANSTDNSLPFMPAAAILPGMLMFDATGGYDSVVSVESVVLTAPVYDIDIAETHNFIANGLVTHNSIYAWRGASSKNILQFERDFPERQMIILARNYRSTQNILEAAMQVVRRNPNRIDKQLWTTEDKGALIEIRETYNEEEEGKFVADTIRLLQARGEAKLSDCAVLYRTNAQSRAIEEQFLRAGVAYVVVGSRKFYDRKEIRDVIAYLRLLNNPRDLTSVRRIINVPSRKIGEITINHLLNFADQRSQTAEEAIATIDEHPTLGPTPKEALRRFAQTITDLRVYSHTVPLDQLIDRIMERTGYAGELRDGSEEGEERWRNVLELRRVAEDYAEADPEAALPLFLENVALIGGADTTQTSADNPELVNEPRDAVTLITLHAAKGLEFPVVFLVGMEEGVLPHSRSLESQDQLEEERRLAYVGITRARFRLYLVRAFRRSFFGGNSVLMDPSRFLGDISRSLVQVSDSPTASRPSVNRPTAPSLLRSTDGPAPFIPREQRSFSGGMPVHPPSPSGMRRPPEVPAEPLPVSEPPQTNAILKAGDIVRHRIYGRGIVMSVTATKDTTTVDVLFDRANIGRKTLDTAFANLQLLEG